MTDLRRGVRRAVTDLRHGRAIRSRSASSAHIDVVLPPSVGYGVGYAVSAALSPSQARVVRNLRRLRRRVDVVVSCALRAKRRLDAVALRHALCHALRHAAVPAADDGSCVVLRLADDT